MKDEIKMLDILWLLFGICCICGLLCILLCLRNRKDDSKSKKISGDDRERMRQVFFLLEAAKMEWLAHFFNRLNGRGHHKSESTNIDGKFIKIGVGIVSLVSLEQRIVNDGIGTLYGEKYAPPALKKLLSWLLCNGFIAHEGAKKKAEQLLREGR